MTRTRTQTALTQLVLKLAEVKGEREFVEKWMAEAGAPAELARRRELLVEQAQALTTTLQLFDPGLRVDTVLETMTWAHRYKRRNQRAIRTAYALDFFLTL